MTKMTRLGILVALLILGDLAVGSAFAGTLSGDSYGQSSAKRKSRISGFGGCAAIAALPVDHAACDTYLKEEDIADCHDRVEAQELHNMDVCQAGKRPGCVGTSCDLPTP